MTGSDSVVSGQYSDSAVSGQCRDRIVGIMCDSISSSEARLTMLDDSNSSYPSCSNCLARTCSKPTFVRQRLSRPSTLVFITVCVLSLLCGASAAPEKPSVETAGKTVVDKTVEANTRSELCSYTLVVHEFDTSKCPATSDAHHTQADGAFLPDGTPHQPVSQYQARHNSARTSDNDEAAAPALTSLVQDVENKLLEEMVRSRALNSTLSRHETLLSEARETLEAYRANFSSVFRQMMLVERKLHKQRKINRSLNKKLSNVILDVVEVNNVISNKLPGPVAVVGTGKTNPGGAAGKKFAVESSAALRSCPGISNATKQYQDCYGLYAAGHHTSGVYYIKPLYSACPIPVWCDMDAPEGGWLLFQRRRDGSQDFDKKWDSYRAGFGDVTGEHWLGNDNLFLLTNQGRYKLRVDLWDFSGNRVHALYHSFKVDGERDDYRLHVSGYSGSAQDSLHKHNQHKFSTPDRDNDKLRDSSCAKEWHAGWWFDNCWHAILNGQYHNRSDVSYRGISWNHWKREQLRASEMKIRPVTGRRQRRG